MSAEARSANLEEILTELRRFRRETLRADDELWEAIEDLHETVAQGGRGRKNGAPRDDTERTSRLDPRQYRRLKRLLRHLVVDELPEGARVAVVSRGDDDLLDFDGVRTEHFPRDRTGQYAGYYPGDGTASIAHLEWVRASGVSHLLFPDSARWWLEAFPRFTEHLETRYDRVADAAGVGLLYDLEPIDAGERGWPEQVATLLEAWEEADEGSPSLLDWDTGWEMAGRLPGRSVFSPPEAGARLPYFDGSVDVVAIAGDEPERSSEARRVANRSIVHLPRRGAPSDLRVGSEETGRLPSALVEHLDGAPPCHPATSIVIPTYNGVGHVVPCLRALETTLGADFVGEVLVVDDGSGPETVSALKTLERRLPWLRVVRNATNAGFIDSCNRGADESEGELLVFLNDDTVPLPGWLQGLQRTFRVRPDAGAVGGRLVYPDGRLQEAGCIVYRDGTGANFGRGDPSVDAPLYRHVRRVDYCSGALLATPRDLFRSLGGFDPRFRPAYYEDTDYCFRVKAEGLSVYYQPESTVVHMEGATSGTDVGGGVKRHQVVNLGTFRRKWRKALRDHPDPPGEYSSIVWHRLAMRGGP